MFASLRTYIGRILLVSLIGVVSYFNCPQAQALITFQDDDFEEVSSEGIVLDYDNVSSGVDLSIIANQGAEPDGIIRYNSTANEWEISNNGGAFAAISTGGAGSDDIDDTYDNFGANPSTVNVDAAEGQTGGLSFVGSLAGDETVTVSNSAAGGGLLVENTGTGDSFRVNDVASDTSPFVIDDDGLIGVGLTVPSFNFHLFDSASSVATEWIGFDDGANQVSILTGTQDPTVVATDADIGSLFLNSSTGQYFIKTDDGSSTNWEQNGFSGDLLDALQGTFGTPSLTNKFVTDADPRLSQTSGNPGETALGTRLDYVEDKKISKNNIFYTRVFFPADTVLNSVGVFTQSSKTGDINMGIYSDSSGPNSKLAETGAQIGVTSPVDGFWEYSLTSPLNISTAGFYWLALASTKDPKARTYKKAEDVFIPYRIEAKANGSSTLPATASPIGLGNTKDLPYIAAFE